MVALHSILGDSFELLSGLPAHALAEEFPDPGELAAAGPAAGEQLQCRLRVYVDVPANYRLQVRLIDSPSAVLLAVTPSSMRRKRGRAEPSIARVVRDGEAGRHRHARQRYAPEQLRGVNGRLNLAGSIQPSVQVPSLQVPSTAAHAPESADSTADADEPTGPRVSHLAPIYLRLRFPADYPSATMPAVHLGAVWVTADSAQLLRDRLEDLWVEQVRRLQVPCVLSAA